ncbi:2-hydroxyacid dehydrogenase [Blastochloris viridis]|uniref:D-lactate dehydrogenase n=1 Tax=Blastochloris viridis TaxID=1079 RepID=A0A0H5BDW6_BLAVI|nr:2-hydroxyacid dehydrogenase [Blastochloris viridis]ALK09723.1 D-lactate dehydrogenase [Blastochloris viridis]BAS00383.1 D-lactate dehydrogenase [Blastochloris viridis]CUU42386.1 D-lactate dehydrogenase [Blastochloris viridis]
MQVAVFSTKPYDRRFLDTANGGRHRLRYLDARLSAETAPLATGADAVCAFVNDELDAETLQALAGLGVRLIALRSAGFNHVDLAAAHRLKLPVAHVPAYSPHAVAEHTLALILTLNRKTHRAYNRVREGNFALDGLLGFDLAGKTAGVVGTGQIGELVSRILIGFGCTILAHDVRPNPACEAMGVRYVERDALFASSDIVSLHCPLTPETRHFVNDALLKRTKRGMMLINTSRGAVIDTAAAIRGLKNGTIGSLGLDVYEEEAHLFFDDRSNRVIQDDVFARLLTFPNVLITGHQAFFTAEALRNIAETTMANLTAFETTGRAVHEVPAEKVATTSTSLGQRA